MYSKKSLNLAISTLSILQNYQSKEKYNTKNIEYHKQYKTIHRINFTPTQLHFHFHIWKNATVNLYSVMSNILLSVCRL